MSNQLSSRRFKLSDTFIDEYVSKPVSWGPLGHVTYLRTYSRRKEDGKREAWWETCRRVIEGTYSIQKRHCQTLNLPWDGRKSQKSAQEMYQRMWEMKFLPPGRGLWMMGTDYVEERGGSSLNNCAFVSTENIDIDFADPFCFMMDMSMLGCGVGFDTLGSNKVRIAEENRDSEVFIVEDSREGWGDLLRTILEGWQKGILPSTIDYSNIRLAGEPIKGFGGVSSGSAPLKRLIEDVNDILNRYRGKLIDSRGIVDLMNAIGRCVVSGNVRRSAQIALGDNGDYDFLKLKDPSEDRLSRWGWASNNSVVLYDGDWFCGYVPERIKVNGEPGIFMIDNSRKWGRYKESVNDFLVKGTNPCGEQSLESFEVCCLVETFPARHDNYEDWKRTLKFAYLYAKTVTLIPTHHPRTNAVMLRNRRIGTSVSGVVQAINKFKLGEFLHWLDNGYKYIKELDGIYSRWMCIPSSIKVTSVKPSGTVSLLTGASPGIHFPFAPYYLRAIRFAKNDELVPKLKEAGYKIEDDKVDTSAVVIYFPVKEDNFKRSRKDVSMWEQLELAAILQEYWSDNAVSCTVTFKPEEEKDIASALEMYTRRLKSISFLPIKDHQYEQAPYQEITKEEYDSYNFSLKRWEGDSTFSEAGGKFCEGDNCNVAQ